MDVKSVILGNLLLVVKAREEKEARRNLTPSSRERSEHELGDGHKNLKLSRGTEKSIEGKRSQKNLESSTSSDEGSLKSKEVNDADTH
uniref:Uncharacterized protein n=1 Tax=Salix viminalis TaxID=40686 RepID=A0A6N2MJC9_SALVM